MKIQKNGMQFTMHGDGSFVCENLKDLPAVFVQTYSSDQVMASIEEYIEGFRMMAEKRFETKEERDAVPEAERLAEGQKCFDTVVALLKTVTRQYDLFEKFLFWHGLWWYYHPELTLGVRFADREKLNQIRFGKLKEYVLPILPKQVMKTVGDMKLTSVASSHGHFAMLFVDEKKSIRRIVTDTQLFELHDVSGYVYLDITMSGKPVARACCERGGGRVFFDGVRLMSHDRFQTCAPATVVIDGGYKVNSTGCTIVNGQLFNLIDSDDKVAQTTGAFLGMVDFTHKDAAKAVTLAQESGKQMHVQNGAVVLAGKELVPIGAFAPSKVSLLESGFALYDFADFHEVHAVQYSRVLVVDDKKEWIESVVAEFGSEVEELLGYETTSAEDALAKILEVNPAVVLLDMHLTADERFDGIWIANRLAMQNFKGKVVIASSYGDEALRAMQKLIKMETIPTGKNLERIRKVLYGKKFN